MLYNNLWIQSHKMFLYLICLINLTNKQKYAFLIKKKNTILQKIYTFTIFLKLHPNVLPFKSD